MNIQSYTLRAPCQKCGGNSGRLETKNGQDCVYCDAGHYQYCAPKTETGRAARTVSTMRDGMKPSRRARLLERDGGRCVLCGASAADKALQIGHLLPVAEGYRQGLTEQEINSDENLAAMCDECNLGLSDRPVSLRLLMAILVARLKLTNGIAQ